MQRNLTFLLAASAVALALGQTARAQHTSRISVDPSGNQILGDHVTPRCSSTGRFVTYTDHTARAYVRDRDPDQNGIFDEDNIASEIVSKSTSGVIGLAQYPDISGDGRWVTFQSNSNNLVPGGSNAFTQVFLRDRDPDANGTFEGNGTTVQILTSTGAEGDWHSTNPRISDDGRFVTFSSLATNMVPGDTNGKRDIFRYEVATGAVELVEVAAGGGFSNGDGTDPVISGDGNEIVFASNATNILQPVAPFGNLYCRDMAAGTTVAINVSSSGTLANQISEYPTISADGSTVAFQSSASNLDPRDTSTDRDVFVRDLGAGTTELASLSSLGQKAFRPSLLNNFAPQLSADGQRVAFASNADNLWWNVPAGSSEMHVYVHDRGTGQTYCASTSSADVLGDGSSVSFFQSLDLSADGHEVVFDSSAKNLVAGNTNPNRDVYGHTLCPDPALDLGYPSLGSNGMTPVLRACGGMATGQTTTLQLRHAPKGRSACIVAASMNPRPAFGGTLVPWHPLQRTLVIVDATGSATMQLTGGGGPGTLYVQWLSWDKGNSPKYVLSNALEVTILP